MGAISRWFAQMRWTRRAVRNLFAHMSTPTPPSSEPAQPAAQKEKLITPASLAVDAVLVLLFFAFMFSVVRSHVQSESPVFIALWGGGAAACLTGVFWLALQMFRAVLRAQRAEKKAK